MCFNRVTHISGFTIEEDWDGVVYTITRQPNDDILPMCACVNHMGNCVCPAYLTLCRYNAQREQGRLTGYIQKKTGRYPAVKTYNNGQTYWAFVGDRKAMGDTPVLALQHMWAIIQAEQED